MQTLWFILIGFMLTMYVVLDGFDLGAGAIHPWAAKTDEERRLILQAIGPVWDGNEVWLIAAGGTMFFAFPVLYASSFSGFYLPLIIVLWLPSSTRPASSAWSCPMAPASRGCRGSASGCRPASTR